MRIRHRKLPAGPAHPHRISETPSQIPVGSGKKGTTQFKPNQIMRGLQSAAENHGSCGSSPTTSNPDLASTRGRQTCEMREQHRPGRRRAGRAWRRRARPWRRAGPLWKLLEAISGSRLGASSSGSGELPFEEGLLRADL